MKDLVYIGSIAKKVSEALDSGNGVISFSVNNDKETCVHMRAGAFFDHFNPDQYKHKERKATDYPFEYFAYVDGVKYFCII